MTTHELSRELLTHPDVPVSIEGWTGNNIKIVRPFYLDESDPDCRMLIDGDTVSIEAEKWLMGQPSVWRNIKP